MARELKNIKLGEVSLVDKAANKRKFLFFKAEGTSDKDALSVEKKKITIGIESDGTAGGTTVTIDGEKVDSLRSFDFGFWQDGDAKSRVSCSYSKTVESEGGFQRTETYYLTKGDYQMDKKIQELLKMYFGDDSGAIEKAAVKAEDIEKVLKTIEVYKKDFPDDLEKAVAVLARSAIWSLDVTANEPVEKAGAKLSKDTISKLKAIIAAAQALLPKEASDDGGVNKSDEDTSELQKTIAELTDSIAKIEKESKSAEKEELTKALEGLTARLVAIENSTGIKKTVDGQEDNNNTSGNVKWPSFQVN